jgi:hypothetical protein
VAVLISVINHTNGLLSDSEVQQAIRAVNRQIREDFEPHWGMSGQLKLEGPAILGSRLSDPDIRREIDTRGEAVIYLWYPTEIVEALGYHARNLLGVSYGFVFPQISRALGEPWTATLSHEALELIADPEVNLLVMGPHPGDGGRTVFHWYEVCDAVQTEGYEIDTVPVSNFVLPLYFTSSEEIGSRNDFLNLEHEGGSLPSFGVNPGGYVGFFDPQLGRHSSFQLSGDNLAAQRLEIKGQLGLARRSQRYSKAGGIPIALALRHYLGEL